MTIRSDGSRAPGIGTGALLAALVAVPAAAQQGGAVLPPVNLAAPADDSQPAQAPPAENPTLKFFAGTEVSGFVDTYYSYNFNKPTSPCTTVGGVAIFNCLHNFDVAHNAFSLSLAEVALEKKPTADSRGGFRLDLDYGSTAALVAGFDPAGTSIYQNIQQAYVSYLAPAGKGTVQLDFGKFVTPAGFEVIEAKDNWNYSRGLLFTLAVPAYHMGIRAAYSPNDKLSITGSLFNGWNNVVDNNTGKSVGISLAAKPNGKLTIVENYLGGPETTGANTPWRHLSDTILTYTIAKPMSLAFNYDWAKDGDVQWQGFAAYLKYQANNWFALTPRYELLKDRDGFTTGTSQNVQDFTLTTDLKHKDGVLMRVEYRGDLASAAAGYFITDTTSLKKNQQALTIAWIYAFSSKTP